MDSLPHAVSLAPLASVDGIWQRHVAIRHARRGLDGVRGRSRWGTPEGFPILYLGSQTESVIVEAFRHLVDPVDVEMINEIRPRMLLTCVVGVTNILDLRTANAQMTTGLLIDILTSPTRDREAYQRCQQVAEVAHQIGLHGLITPAATKIGDTLALFTQNLPNSERPEQTAEEIWTQLPPDPRGRGRGQLRVVRPLSD